MKDNAKTKPPLLADIQHFRRPMTPLQKPEQEKGRAEEALHLANARNRVLIETSLDAVLTISLEGEVTDVNTAAELMLGYSRSELIGSRFSRCFTKPTQVEQGYQRLLEGNPFYKRQFNIQHKQGRTFPVLCNVSVYRDEADQVKGAIACVRDISELQHLNLLEAERARADKRIQQLTQQIINVQEAERRRISQDLHDDIGQSMTALILRLSSIQISLLPDQQSVKAGIQEAIQSVEALTNQIRQLAYQLRPPSLDSMPLSKALASLCSLFAQKSGLAVHYSSDPDLPPIPNIQATALYRLAQEGLSNAVKQSQASSIWVNLDYADGEVGLSIEDNGRGLDHKQIGYGMGLQGIRDRFLMANGSFDIESAPGKGTRLYGCLPLANHSL